MPGVSFTITGIVAASMTQLTIFSVTGGCCPTAEPMPRSHMPCGQPKLSSRPSPPASIERLMMSFHSSFVSTMSETMIACFGYFFFVS